MLNTITKALSMAITKRKKHNKAQVKAIKGPFGPHFGKLVTQKRNRHIQWLSEADYNSIQAIETGLKNDPSMTESNNAK